MTSTIRELCSRIASSLTETLTNPISARLSQWLRGEIELSEARLVRYQRVLGDKLVLTRLDFIEHSVFASLQRGLTNHVAGSAEKHALRLLGVVNDNRTGLRKFLKAYWSGDRQYLSKHAATRVWYRNHKSIKREIWEQGIALQSDQLTIQMEQNPFEILKLGTYVGSCLGLGGGFSCSALAALLDVNKQVLYARNHRGVVVARQLIAKSDDERLVCFPVYPVACAASVKARFREYDLAFAQVLALPIYQAEEGCDDSYQVSCVLACDWWDDGSWDLNTSD